MRRKLVLLLLAVTPGFAAEVEHSLPLFFFPNTGQTDSSIRYVAQTAEMHAGFRSDSAIFQVHGINGGMEGGTNAGMNVTVRFIGADPRVSIDADGLMPGKANFFQGDRPQDWRTNVPTYQRVVYRGLYPGIDMVYGGTDRSIKSEFIVAPGADPSVIRLAYSGASTVFIDADGDLVVKGSRGELREEAPLVYQNAYQNVYENAASQDTGSARVPVKGRYRMLDESTVGFEIEGYDSSKPLIIDPVISYSTYLGGSGMGAVTGVAAGSGGNLYATGWTEALNFPIAGAVQAANQGGVDAFIVKLNPAGSSLLYATYIGGRGDDRGAGIAVDASGQAYVTGATSSTNFPLASPIRSSRGGSKTAFALKLNSTGNLLVYSTYLGGTNYEFGTGIAVDSLGNAYIAGDTLSTNFPVLGATQPTLGGGTDAFVTELSPSGSLVFSTFLGGAGNEHAGGIALDVSRNIYVAGGTYSINFPTLAAIQAVNGGAQDAFLTKFSTGGSTKVYSTYLGGNGTPGSFEQATGVAVDSAGSAYVTGVTGASNFPAIAGSQQTSFNGGVQDAFVAKINPAGTALVYSTFLGGSGFDWGNGIAVDSAGNAYVAGYTASLNFAAVGGVQTGFKGFYDGFVSKLSPSGDALTFSTYYGGTGADVVNAIALDSSGNIFVGGQTNSFDFPLQGAIQSSNIGGSTAWLARLGVAAPPPQTPAANSVAPSSGSGNAIVLTAQYSDSGGAATLTSVALLINTSASDSFACYVTYDPATNRFGLAADTPSSGSTVVVPGGASAQNSQCTLKGVGSSAVISGSTLTLTVSLIFQPAFTGSKTVYLYAADAGSNTGWVSRGTWNVTVPPPHPTADSVSPNAGSGSTQTFSFVFSDTQSASNITGMAVLFSASLSFPNSCFILYDTATGIIALVRDSAASSDFKSIGSTAILQNSQCSLGTSSIQTSGLSDILTLSITFKGTFSGQKKIYMYAAEGAINTGWAQAGTFNVAVGGVPTATSVVPSSGSGPAQRFSFTISDQGGAGYLTGMAILVAPTFNSMSACSLVYDRTLNQVSLAYDNPAAGAIPLVLGSNTSVSNSQCTLNGANTTLVIGTTSIVLTLDLAFNSAWFGPKNVYLLAAEPGVNSIWSQAGSWTVTGGSPTADSVSPASGSGTGSTFVFTSSDSTSAANISGMAMLFTTGAPTNTAGACYLVYNRTNATIGLYADNGVTLNMKGIGSMAALQNSNCAVGFTMMTTSGNSVIFNIFVQFVSPAFSGTKTVYLQANEPGSNSGWVSRGSWTIP